MRIHKIKTLFRGSLWGGASRKERLKYKNRLGNLKRKIRIAEPSHIFKAATRFEQDPNRLLWCSTIFNEAFIQTAFKGKTKKFMQQFIFKSELTKRSEQYAKFARSLGLNFTGNSWHTIRGYLEKRQLLENALKAKPNRGGRLMLQLLRQIANARHQYEGAMKKAHSLTFSVEALNKYPETAACLRHNLLNAANAITGNLDALEGIIKIYQKEFSR